MVLSRSAGAPNGRPYIFAGSSRGGIVAEGRMLRGGYVRFAEGLRGGCGHFAGEVWLGGKRVVILWGQFDGGLR